jgi:hypothetical protein
MALIQAIAAQRDIIHLSQLFFDIINLTIHFQHPRADIHE